MRRKICSKCKNSLKLDNFSDRKGQPHSWCKNCVNAKSREHYQAHREKYRKRSQDRRDKIRQFIREEKSKPCMDCGESYPYYVMEFDHRPEHEKSFKISDWWRKKSGLGIEKIQLEIDKCDVICANCHRERTHQRTQNP